MLVIILLGVGLWIGWCLIWLRVLNAKMEKLVKELEEESEEEREKFEEELEKDFENIEKNFQKVKILYRKGGSNGNFGTFADLWIEYGFGI